MRAASSELLLLNGQLVTLDPRLPVARAAFVRDGRILYLGVEKDARKLQTAATRVIDLGKGFAYPGFADSHYHLSGVGLRSMSYSLEEITNLAALLSSLRAQAAKTKPGKWIVGFGWIEKEWKPQRFPTRQELDLAAPENPVWLVRADGHSGVANSLALKLAGITKETPSPQGGAVMKDDSGEPTGMLLDSAMGLVQRVVRTITPPYREQMLAGIREALSKGWTQVQVAGGSYLDIETLEEIQRSEGLRLRIYQAVHGPTPSSERLLREGPRLNDGFLILRTIKIVFDGALGSRGAALLDPYSDHPSSGFFTANEERVRLLLREALQKGIQVETHAIGDRANRRVLDLYEEAFAAVPVSERRVAEPRWRIEHAQIVHPDDVPRFRKLGIIPSMQPSHAIGDLHFATSRLGKERLNRGYAWRRFLDAGCIIAGGSDAPVERGDPRIELYAAVARRDLKGFQGENWHPEQAVSRLEALRMFTEWPAFATFQEKRRGTLEAGKWADLTVFDRDLLRMPITEVPKAKILHTIVGGKIAFSAGN